MYRVEIYIGMAYVWFNPLWPGDAHAFRLFWSINDSVNGISRFRRKPPSTHMDVLSIRPIKNTSMKFQSKYVFIEYAFQNVYCVITGQWVNHNLKVSRGYLQFNNTIHSSAVITRSSKTYFIDLSSYCGRTWIGICIHNNNTQSIEKNLEKMTSL